MKKTVEINYLGAELEIEGTFTPSEKEERFDSNMTGVPESPAEFEILKVIAGGTNIIGILYESQLDEIINLCLEKMEDE